MCMRLLNAVIDRLGLTSAKGAIRRSWTSHCEPQLTTAHDALLAPKAPAEGMTRGMKQLADFCLRSCGWLSASIR